MEKNNMTREVAPSGTQHPQAFQKTISKTLGCKYLLSLPEDYGRQQKRWPLMLFLHGAGERGDDLEKVKKHGPPKIVQTQKDLPFIVVSPQCPEGDWWTKKTEVLIHLLDEIIARYDVDTERIYLTGLSMGGYGSWALASEYPDRFAAVVPICGGGSRMMSLTLKDVPIWAFHGAKDPVVPVEESKDIVEAINRRGGNTKLTIYPDAKHDSWTQTYNSQELYDWLLGHRRVGEQ
ncbi:MAG: prolyl oligopeptidase family serine peptidase [Phycisphaerales bacterium]|nr:MAG: prolyl oligopeptidase family serine peptidase [Phycisphaerales bacterium]